MAKISLRIYKKEIENLIDRGQLEEAIAHSKYILSEFPKYIDAYRLLAKAYLESQKYKEAGDIFQRVLSAIPDDFISQIGMSIVKEDAGDLDGAIWHMERAFEAQPSNAPIQQELKRLYGRRDGVEPQKIRLTKGVLVRMYARSRLFPQAIAEARDVLAEDPGRLDLELILAQMYFQSNQKLDATEIASKVVSKLPFCLEANRILSEVLINTSRAEDARKYRERVNTLDPYSKFVAPGTSNSDEVPDNAVTIERLVWQNGIATPTIPNLDLSDFSQPPEAKDEFSAVSEQEVKPSIPEVMGNPIKSESTFPDWMKTAGWEPSTDQIPKGNIPVQGEEKPAEPAEIPDWLQQLSNQNLPVSEAERAVNPSEEPVTVPPIVEGEPEENVSTPESSEESVALRPESKGATVPEWLRETIVDKTTSMPAESAGTDSAIEPVEPAVQTPPEMMPSWLQEIKSQSTFETGSASIESPTSEAIESDTSSEPQPEVKMPWLESLGKTEIPETASEPTIVNQPSSNWLDDLGTQTPPEKIPPAQQSEDLPQWLREIDITPEGEESLKKTPPTGSLNKEGDIPSWLQELKAAAPPEPSSETTSAEPVPEEPTGTAPSELKDWLSSLDNEPNPVIEPFAPTNNLSVEQISQIPETPSESIPRTPLNVVEIKQEETPLAIPPLLAQAEKAMASHDLTHALDEYRQMIKSGTMLDQTIESIQKEIDKNSTEALLWQLLGDAYAKNNQLREALDAYNKAEQCL